MIRLLLFAAVAYLSFACTAAQAQDGNDGQTNDPVLPEIAPREVEILGELDISLPSLQRQPLIGFNPPPRVAEIPAGRTPYVENFLESQADLPQSPLQRPDLPEISSLAGKTPINGEFEAGAGRYFSRVVRGRSALPISQQTGFYARLDYAGSDEFALADAAPDVTADFDDLSGQVGIQNIFGRVIGGVEFDGLYERYALYGVGAPTSSGSGLVLHPSRQGSGLSGGLWLRTHGDTRADIQARVQYGGTLYETLATSDETSPENLIRAEQRLAASTELRYPVGSGMFLADADVVAASLDNAETPSGAAASSLSHYDVGGGFGFLFRRTVNLQLGVRVMGFSALHGEPLLNGEGADSPALYVAPEIQAELFPVRGLRIYAQNRPGVEGHALASLFERNPFLVAEPEVLPTVRTVNAEAGAGIYAGIVKLAGRVGYQFAPSFLFFEDAGQDYPSEYRYLAAARYDEAEIMFAGGDLSIVLPGGFQATVGGAVREGQLTAGEVDIPYFGPIVGHAMFSLPFAQSRGLFQMTAEYESARYIDLEKSRKIGDFFDLDTALFYNVTPALGFVVRVNNISADHLERWNRHPYAPLVAMGGMRVRW